MLKEILFDIYYLISLAENKIFKRGKDSNFSLANISKNCFKDYL